MSPVHTHGNVCTRSGGGQVISSRRARCSDQSRLRVRYCLPGFWLPCLLLRVKPPQPRESGPTRSNGRTPPDSGHAAHRGGVARAFQLALPNRITIEPRTWKSDPEGQAGCSRPPVGRLDRPLVAKGRTPASISEARLRQASSVGSRPLESAVLATSITARLFVLEPDLGGSPGVPVSP
jgi:hypothetical protein